MPRQPRTRLYQYKAGSRSARALAQELGILRLKNRASRFVPRIGDTIINWGSSIVPAEYLRVARVLNIPQAVAVAANKRSFFQSMANAGLDDTIPAFWTDRDSIPEDAYPIVCRTILTGHSGAGIVIADSPDELVHAPLYVKYIKKQEEYRIHVGGDSVIGTQRKARSLSVPSEQVNWQIRNHANGFIFARNEISVPQPVLDVALSAVTALSLNFGAVDVVWNSHDSLAYALEVNTAPGLEGTTVTEYGDYFRSII